MDSASGLPAGPAKEQLSPANKKQKMYSPEEGRLTGRYNSGVPEDRVIISLPELKNNETRKSQTNSMRSKPGAAFLPRAQNNIHATLRDQAAKRIATYMSHSTTGFLQEVQNNIHETQQLNVPSSRPTSSQKAPGNKTPSEAIDPSMTSRFSADNVIALLVGKDEQEMIAHGSQLARDSDIFDRAMKKARAEGQTRTIKLTEECPTTMSHYLSYLYSEKLFTEDITSMVEDQITPCFRLLALLYVSGERYLNRRIQSAVVKEILRLTLILDENLKYCYPTGEQVNIIYRGTPAGSPGRRLLVDLHVVMGVKEWMDHNLEAEFSMDVAKRSMTA